MDPTTRPGQRARVEMMRAGWPLWRRTPEPEGARLCPGRPPEQGADPAATPAPSPPRTAARRPLP